MEPIINENIIKEIDVDLRAYEDYLREVSTEIRDTKISKYPIFIVHQNATINLGKAIIDKNRSHTKWSVNVSLIEELINKNIFSIEKAKEFTKIYKDPDKFVCIFVIFEKHHSFIFRPYTSTINKK